METYNEQPGGMKKERATVPGWSVPVHSGDTNMADLMFVLAKRTPLPDGLSLELVNIE